MPIDFTDFLYWVKEKTENCWSIISENTECEQWLYGAKWQGLTDTQIDSIENEFAIRFTVEHRAFLRVLHTIDRYEIVEEEDGQNGIQIKKRPYFYNWLIDQTAIKECISWPFDTILFDVLEGQNQVWLKSWGEKPDSDEEKEAVFIKWYHGAPKLLPLRAHTFLVSDPDLERRPVLSVWGADTIICGWSLRAYLVSQFAYELDLLEKRYSEEDKGFHYEFKADALPIFNEYFQFKLAYPIPYWDEMISYFNSDITK